MDIKRLLALGRETRGDQRLNLSQVIIRMGKVFGDLCKQQRDSDSLGASINDEETMKELGNMIYSSIRRCDDLGYDPEECVKKAIECQKQFKK